MNFGTVLATAHRLTVVGVGPTTGDFRTHGATCSYRTRVELCEVALGARSVTVTVLAQCLGARAS
jgi:hypothetical protein